MRLFFVRGEFSRVLLSEKGEGALFFIQKTIEAGWSRNTLDNCIRADYYHKTGGAKQEGYIHLGR